MCYRKHADHLDKWVALNMRVWWKNLLFFWCQFIETSTSHSINDKEEGRGEKERVRERMNDCGLDLCYVAGMQPY